MQPELILRARIRAPGLLPEGALGVDAGLTLTKFVRATGAGIEAAAFVTEEAAGGLDLLRPVDGAPAGITGARAAAVVADGMLTCQEIDAAAHGAAALMSTSGDALEADFVLALLGTGTAFAAVSDGAVQHLGGTALGGGSFFGIARRVVPGMSYEDLVASAVRGDRRKADIMLFDAYPEGIGRLANADMTAAHLSKVDAGSDDFLAGLLNLHGESIAQIAASRATIARIRHVVLVGGFAQGNDALTRSIAAMCALFGVRTDVAPHPGYAGALGAAILAAKSRNGVV